MASDTDPRRVGKHRAEELPVRRWLQLSAASAGMGAALLGWSLIGSDATVASAETGVDASSASTGPSASPAKGVTSGAAPDEATSSASRDDAGPVGPSATSRRLANTAAAEGDGAEPADAAGLAERRGTSLARTADSTEPATSPSAAGTSSVADRFVNSTSVRPRVASRTATAPDVNAFGSAVAGLLGQPKAAAQPATAPGAKVTWNFVYTEGAEYWTPERRRELEQSAEALNSYFAAPVPVTITYEVRGQNEDNGLLGFALSPNVDDGSGFYNTVVQEKFITGLDLNGPEFDGRTTFNFHSSNNWGLGYQLTDDQVDFVSTAMHEMLHSLGFASQIGAPGTNTGSQWPWFARYVVDERGERVIQPDYRFDTVFNPNLVGWNGGMYFGGPEAVAAYGGKLIPLYTPYPWKGGSSMSHLDPETFSGPNVQMMNPDANKTGNDRRVLSPIEQGIMADIGYRVIFQAPAPYAPPVAGAFLGFLLLRRRRKPETAEN